MGDVDKIIDGILTGRAYTHTGPFTGMARYAGFSGLQRLVAETYQAEMQFTIGLLVHRWFPASSDSLVVISPRILASAMPDHPYWAMASRWLPLEPGESFPTLLCLATPEDAYNHYGVLISESPTYMRPAAFFPHLIRRGLRVSNSNA